jgi:hypothetical protein
MTEESNTQAHPVPRAIDQSQRIIESLRSHAIVTFDRVGNVETWNSGAECIYGYPPDEIVGKPLAELYPAAERITGAPARLLAEARARSHAERDVWQARRDGTTFWAEVVFEAIHDRGDFVGFALVARDRTMRQRAEDQHRERFRNLVENARDYAIFLLDTAGHVATWNVGAQRIKGYAAEEIIGQHFSTFYPSEAARSGKCERELEAALRDGRFEDEGWRIRKDGSRFWANVVIQPLHNRAGTHIGFSKITRDLTERRDAEQDRIRLAHTEEALRLRDEFFSIAAHELRTPLGALTLQLDSLREQANNLGPRQLRMVDRAARNVERLADLIAALLDVSRISKGRLVLALKPFDLASLVSDVVDRLNEAAHAARCTIVLDLEPNVIGEWDALRIEQVISNIISNAFKYAAGTEIQVTLSRVSEEAVISIGDRGGGIPPNDLERIFQRFERAAPTHNFAGMGLGLYVAREIVVAHGGTIRASNRPGGGAVVEFRLPIHKNISIAAPYEVP